MTEGDHILEALFFFFFFFELVVKRKRRVQAGPRWLVCLEYILMAHTGQSSLSSLYPLHVTGLECQNHTTCYCSKWDFESLLQNLD